MRGRVVDIVRYQVGSRLCEVAEYGGVLYLAGQVAESCDGDIRSQTTEVLGAVEKLLAIHGSTKTHLLQCLIYLANQSDFEVMNEVWDSWVLPGTAPPRATVQAGFFKEGRLIEVVVVAACGT
jgi:enamine deaminase RidA (YjgF/YER057c/UK114 family)